MSTNYYFINKNFNTQKLDNINSKYKNEIEKVYNNYINDISSLSDNTQEISLPKIEFYTVPKIHIVKISKGWKPLLQCNEYFSSMKDIINFYNSNEYDLINEYNEYSDFKKLVNEINDMYKDKDNKSHLGLDLYYMNNYYIDSQGYEFTNLDFC